MSSLPPFVKQGHSDGWYRYKQEVDLTHEENINHIKREQQDQSDKSLIIIIALIAVLVVMGYSLICSRLNPPTSREQVEVEQPAPISWIVSTFPIDDAPDPLLPGPVPDVVIVKESILEYAYVQPGHPRLSDLEALVIANEILYWMNRHRFPEDGLPYVLGLFYQESGFDPLSENPNSYARGLGQILIFMHEEKLSNYGGDWRNIETNLAVAFEILDDNYDRNNNLEGEVLWRAVFRGYTGTSQGSQNALRWNNRFREALEHYAG